MSPLLNDQDTYQIPRTTKVKVVYGSENGLLGRTRILSEWMSDGETYLDVGCSDGEVVGSVGSRCSKAVGLDVDTRTMTEARKRYPDFDFVLGSADNLPFEDESFTTVSMLDVLEHVPNPEKSLSEIDRVLKPGGYLIISVPHKGSFWFIDAQRSRIFAAGRKILLGKYDSVLEHKHYKTDELLKMLPSYTVVNEHYGGLLLYPLCGYVLMFTDSLGVKRLSDAIRRIEESDFQRDYGNKSWHLMMQLKKGEKQ